MCISLSLSLSVCVYIYIYIDVCILVTDFRAHLKIIALRRLATIIYKIHIEATK